MLSRATIRASHASTRGWRARLSPEAAARL
jgi:hypothetical protein